MHLIGVSINEDGVPFTIMELMEGGSLDKHLKNNVRISPFQIHRTSLTARSFVSAWRSLRGWRIYTVRISCIEIWQREIACRPFSSALRESQAHQQSSHPNQRLWVVEAGDGGTAGLHVPNLTLPAHTLDATRSCFRWKCGYWICSL